MSVPGQARGAGLSAQGVERAAPTSLRIPLIVACAFFMEHLDSTIISTALPKMAASFGENPISLNAGVTAYVLTLAVFIPVSAWLAERFGARNVFGSAIGIFTLASMICGASPSLPVFLAARVLQGIGGAMMVPVGRILVIRGTPKSELLRAMAFLTWPALVGPVVGPFVGGLLATYFSWRWIFYINVPIGIVGIALAIKFIPAGARGTQSRFDLGGFILTGTAMTGLLVGLEFLAHGGEPASTIILTLLAAAIASTLAWRHIRNDSHPLVDLSPFRVSTFAATGLGGSFSRFAVSAGLFVMPLLFQVGFGLSPFVSGLLMLIGAAGSLSTKAIAARLVRRFGFRRVLILNSGGIGLATLACAGLTADLPLSVMGAAMVACGFSRSLQFTCLNTLGFADMPPAKVPAASMLTSMLQQLATGVGVAFAAIVLRLLSLLHEGGITYIADIRWTLAILAMIACLSAIRFARLPPDAGDAISGHGR